VARLSPRHLEASHTTPSLIARSFSYRPASTGNGTIRSASPSTSRPTGVAGIALTSTCFDDGGAAAEVARRLGVATGGFIKCVDRFPVGVVGEGDLRPSAGEDINTGVSDTPLHARPLLARAGRAQERQQQAQPGQDQTRRTRQPPDQRRSPPPRLRRPAIPIINVHHIIVDARVKARRIEPDLTLAPTCRTLTVRPL